MYLQNAFPSLLLAVVTIVMRKRMQQDKKIPAVLWCDLGYCGFDFSKRVCRWDLLIWFEILAALDVNNSVLVSVELSH